MGLGVAAVDTLVDSTQFIVMTLGGVNTRTQALRVEALFDATADSARGTVRWSGADANDSIPGRAVKVYLTSSR